MKIEEKLVCLRKKSGLTQAELAEKMNVSRQAISRWEVGAATPATENLKSLSELYGVPLDYLLNDEFQNLDQKQSVSVIEDTKSEFWWQNKKYLISVGLAVIGLLVVIMFYYMGLSKESSSGDKHLMSEQRGGEIITEEEFDVTW